MENILRITRGLERPRMEEVVHMDCCEANCGSSVNYFLLIGDLKKMNKIVFYSIFSSI